MKRGMIVILKRFCGALLTGLFFVTAAHAAGILHRDIKPTNILFTTSGDGKVAESGSRKVLGRQPR